MITGEELTADDIRTYGAELVVVATGSSWAVDGFSVYAGGPIAVDDPRTVTPEQVLDGLPDGDVAVLDCEGYLVGVGCAELALQRGRKVTYHSPFDRVAPLLDETLESWRCVPAGRGGPADGAVTGEPGRGRGRCDRAGHAAAFRRRPVSRAGGGSGRRRGRLPGGRLRRPAHPRRRDLRRPSPGQRDRQRGPRGAPPVAPRARQRAVRRAKSAGPSQNAREQSPRERTGAARRNAHEGVSRHAENPPAECAGSATTSAEQARATHRPCRGDKFAARQRTCRRHRFTAQTKQFGTWFRICRMAQFSAVPRGTIGAVRARRVTSQATGCVCQYVPNSSGVSTSGPGREARQPPSTGTEAPVMNDASSERRNATTAATSDG